MEAVTPKVQWYDNVYSFILLRHYVNVCLCLVLQVITDSYGIMIYSTSDD